MPETILQGLLLIVPKDAPNMDILRKRIQQPNDEEQIELARFVDEMHKKGAKIVVSNSDPKNSNTEDDFFDNIYKAHKIKRVEATRMINCNSEARGRIRELLISNY